MLDENIRGILNCADPANESTDNTSIMTCRILFAAIAFFIILKTFWMAAISDMFY